jgi:Mrp family chromosome partitioning ATPase
LAQAVADGDPPYLNPVENLPHLSVLTAGAMSTNPVELLSDGRFELLVSQWRKRYEHVVIDTSPLSEYSDALAVATLVGRVLMVTRAKHTHYKATREMMRRLAATQSQVVGAVVNHY